MLTAEHCEDVRQPTTERGALVSDSVQCVVGCRAPEDVSLALDAVCAAVTPKRLVVAHVVVFTDVGMNPWSSNLAYTRHAPVQVAFWGHHGTSGLQSIDFFLVGDAFEPPGGQNKYSEQLVRMDRGLGVYLTFDDFRLAPTSSRGASNALGIPDSAHVVIIPQSLPKFHPAFDAAIAGVLRADPHAVILIPVDAHGQSGAVAELQHRLRRSLGRDDDLARLVFPPRLSQESMATLLGLAHLALDPFPVGGGITSLELLAAGTPVVTLAPEQTAIRTTDAAYRAMGLFNLSASSVPEYVSLATRMLTDKDYASDVASQLKGRSHLIFERNDTVQEWCLFLRSLSLAEAT